MDYKIKKYKIENGGIFLTVESLEDLLWQIGEAFDHDVKYQNQIAAYADIGQRVLVSQLLEMINKSLVK